MYVLIQKGIVGLGILPTSNQNNQPEHPCFERGLEIISNLPVLGRLILNLPYLPSNRQVYRYLQSEINLF